MKINTIPYQKTGYISTIISDYLEQKKGLKNFYENFPDMEGFEKQILIAEKRNSEFSRQVLVNSLKNQYKHISASLKTTQNIKLLLKSNTFTITTGHQLNLFTGPLYFIYKIISTINLCEKLSKQFPKTNFVPIYWMATEDHDFDEIKYFNFNEKKVQWNRHSGGAVGEFTTDGLEEVFKLLSKEFGNSTNAKALKVLFQKGYLEHDNLSDATRYITNELFGTYGLTILDGNDKILKQQFIPFIKDELQHQTSYKLVSKTIKVFPEKYKVQVNPRALNLFYLNKGIRERIIKEDNIFKINNTSLTFSEEEILNLVEISPEKFSPNVILRPLFQEVVLPNLCYIGGGGELGYWFELKQYFEHVNIPFPILLLRNSVLIISEKQNKKLEKLNISLEEIFLKQNDLIAKKVKENSELRIDFSKQKAFLKQQFIDLKVMATKTDISFIGAVNAQEKKQIKGLVNLEKRLLKAEKRRQVEFVKQMVNLQNELFPNQGLEERQRNFSEPYLAYGETFIDTLKDSLNPLLSEFTCITL